MYQKIKLRLISEPFFGKSMGYSIQGIFQKLANFKNGHNSKTFSRNQLKLST